MSKMFDVDPFTESTIEEVLDYIEIELLGDQDPITVYMERKSAEISKRIMEELSEMDTLGTIYRMTRK